MVFGIFGVSIVPMSYMRVIKVAWHKKKIFRSNPSIRDGVHRSGMLLYMHLKRI